MKNNIVFKFIAILLCAASLLGALGGIAGVVVMAEGDLYNKTAPQVKAERIESNALHYANTLAYQYTSTELGGCPENMISDIYDNGHWFARQYPSYGYIIRDAEGNILSAHNEALQESALTFNYSPSGQYAHLVSSQSRTQIAAEEAQKQADALLKNSETTDSADPLLNAGILIDQVIFMGADGGILYEAYRDGADHFTATSYADSHNSYTTGYSSSHAGFLFCNQDGRLVYTSFLTPCDPIPTDPICEIFFTNTDRSFVFQKNDPENLGSFYQENDMLIFVSDFTLTEEAEENTPMVVEEPVPVEAEPAWTVEQLPDTDRMMLTSPDGTSFLVQIVPPQQEEAAPPQTQPEEPVPADTPAPPAEAAPQETTVTETVPSSASAPPETITVTAPMETVVPTEPVMMPPVTAPPQPATLPPETVPEETVPEVTEPILINGKTLDHYQVNTHEYWDPELQDWVQAKYVYLPMPELTVEVFVDETAMADAYAYDLMALLRQYSSYLLPAIVICLLVFAVFAVYLCTAAARKPKTDEVRAGGLNRLPLDLYLCLAALAAAGCGVLGVGAFQYLIQQDLLVACAVTVGLFFAISLIFVAFCFAFISQLKTPGGFWWRNTLCGHCIRLFIRFAVWLEHFLGEKFFPWLGRTLKRLWNFICKAAVWCYHALENTLRWIGTRLGAIFRWIGRTLHRWLSLMPVTWQWTVTGCFLFCMTLIAGATYNDVLTVLCILVSLALILYGAHCFGILLESTKKMSKGDLDTKVDDKLMVGSFKEFAEDLNDLADVAVVAAQKQLKSERMKTELITNVSHDIKTPLTSIINYVDLLQKPHTDEEQAQYLEVLDRQSQRLKKLIDDLMDMSKANTGNMQVDITRLDAVESVNQALGEFADKLTRAQLIPVFRHDEDRVPMMADGRLVWRVLSNLLSNAVKYAMPGTRLYIDLMTLEGKVIISLKNISREELNIDADELMERFVRGDDSRNTEGSGLGLNIAKSLMELQKGQLQLLVDGDLFKVTLIFPGE